MRTRGNSRSRAPAAGSSTTTSAGLWRSWALPLDHRLSALDRERDLWWAVTSGPATTITYRTADATGVTAAALAAGSETRREHRDPPHPLRVGHAVHRPVRRARSGGRIEQVQHAGRAGDRQPRCPRRSPGGAARVRRVAPPRQRSSRTPPGRAEPLEWPDPRSRGPGRPCPEVRTGPAMVGEPVGELEPEPVLLPATASALHRRETRSGRGREPACQGQYLPPGAGAVFFKARRTSYRAPGSPPWNTISPKLLGTHSRRSKRTGPGSACPTSGWSGRRRSGASWRSISPGSWSGSTHGSRPTLS